MLRVMDKKRIMRILKERYMDLKVPEKWLRKYLCMDDDEELSPLLKEYLDTNEPLENELRESQYKEILGKISGEIFKNKISEKAIENALSGETSLIRRFYKKERKDKAVLTMDIRKSTTMMLEASSPELFADFLSGFVEGIRKIIVDADGIFVKFTGDGILAVFPEYYSGENAIVKCCYAASKCNEFFQTYYKTKYDNFDIVLKTGLGIGIDYGDTMIVNIAGNLDIVGLAVVYACRLACVPSGYICLSQSAVKRLHKCGKIAENVLFEEVEIDLKNEGTFIVKKMVGIMA
jgi:class 3 adenylate cyclase